MRRFDWTQSCSGIFAFAFSLCFMVSCSSDNPPTLESPTPDKIVLYEGLPHQGYEPQVFAEESKKPTISKGGFLFYKEPLTLKEDDLKATGLSLSNPNTFTQFQGEKKCGGFHPDYAIVVTLKGEEITYLICFGCGEAKIYRPDGSETRYDLGHDPTSPSLSTILKPYQKNRPAPVHSPG